MEMKGSFSSIERSAAISEHIKNWGDMPVALLRWKLSGYKNFPCKDDLWKIRITSPPMAIDIVEPEQQQSPGSSSSNIRSKQQGGQLQQPAQPEQETPESPRADDDDNDDELPEADDGDDDEPPGADDDDDDYMLGRPLVEMFVVRANFHLIGTIAVFDGRRGQIIYENKDGAPSVHGSGDYAALLLTGPFRAITAYGSFTIKVDVTSPATGSRDIGYWNWKCYDETSCEFDYPVTDTIKTNSGSEVEVIYAVLSNAVEANVEVYLRLPEATTAEESRVVYGHIATRSELFVDNDTAWSVLFDSELQGQGARLTIDDPSEPMPRLPLARSVLAVPLGWRLEVEASLYDTPPSQQGVVPIFQSKEYLWISNEGNHIWNLLGEHGGEVKVKITSPDF